MNVALTLATDALVVPPPGPRTLHSDAEVVEAIRAVLAAYPFHREGYRKVRARLANRGLYFGGKRILLLMRLHGLLAPRRLGPANENPAHDGTITTYRPDVMWGRTRRVLRLCNGVSNGS